MKIRDLEILDLRFPTSRTADGTDAMHPDPDYSAAYVIVKTDSDVEGHGFTFTIGRGNEVCVEAIRAFTPLVVGRTLEEIVDQPAGFWRELASESQLRWLGPEKGVIHISMAAIINAVWDLHAKREKKPVWKLLADMTPRQVAACIDFRYITDALTADEAIDIMSRQERTKGEREAQLLREGYPAYTTSAGWIGYSDDKIRHLCREALADGWTHFKVKVGATAADDRARVGLVRQEIGPASKLMIDANQRWDVSEAIERVRALADLNLLWIEEPTSPDDVLGHAAIRKGVRPVGVATGEHAQNRIIFKQLLQAEAIDVMQIDAARVAGVNENLANLLLAAKFGVRVCPHAGGVGLCEAVQHLSMIDFVAISGTIEDRYLEFVDHLHEHFVDPVQVVDGHYIAPTTPGAGTEMNASSLEEYRYRAGRAS